MTSEKYVLTGTVTARVRVLSLILNCVKDRGIYIYQVIISARYSVSSSALVRMNYVSLRYKRLRLRSAEVTPLLSAFAATDASNTIIGTNHIT